MNISKIADMLLEDPSIADNIQHFLNIVNEPNIEQVVKVTTTTVDETRTISFAEQHGGKATERDVLDAIAYLKQQPLLEEAQTRFEKTVTAICCGEVQESSDITEKFSE